jgi:2-iminobutanoate/2-iminopropanoate deaminase
MTDSSDREQTSTGPFDVAIVGGGIAGLYAAYRLQKAWNSKEGRAALLEQLPEGHGELLQVVILEQNPYGIGGRLRSVELPFPGGSVTAELGAMRFTTRQKLVRRLLNELEIRTVPFEGDGFSSHYYLRGKHFDAADIAANDETRFPYHVAEGEKNKLPSDLMLHVLDRTLQELSLDDAATPEALLVLEKLRNKDSRESLTHHEWAEIQKHGLLMGHVRLNSIGMWNLIHHYLSPEAAHFVEDGFGYESVIGNWNLSDAIPWFIADFDPGQVYETVDKSFSELVHRIKERIAPDDPVDSKESETFLCTIVWNARVTQLHKGGPGFLLNVETTDLEYKHRTQVAPKLCASIVILALPKKPLEDLKVKWLQSENDVGSDSSSDSDGDLDSDNDRANDSEAKWNKQLANVRPHRLVKIVQAYRTAWWRTAKTPKGAGQRTLTDLPLRQVYYLDREWLKQRGRIKYDVGESGAADGVNNTVTSAKEVGESCHRKDQLNNKRVDGQRDEAPRSEIEGIVVAYLDGHHAAFWRFITAVQRIHDLKRRDLHAQRDREAAIVKARKRSREREIEKRESFGKRIWGWLESGEGDPNRWRDLYENPVEGWSPQQRAEHLYFQRYGLYERASLKMTHLLQCLHRGTPNDRGEHIAVPVPVAGAYTFWDNFADSPIPEAGWHTWEPGVDSAKAMESMVQPFGRKKHVFVCGEAYSSEQGWIEGALKSVELVMDRLGVLLPDEVQDTDANPDARKDSEGIRDYVGLPPHRVPHEEKGAARGHVSVAIAGGQSMVFLSGQSGFGSDLPTEPNSIEVQTARALDRLIQELAVAKGLPGNIVSVRVSLRSMDDYPRFNEAYSQALTKHGPDRFPARSVVAVKALRPGALVEIDAIAVIDSERDAPSG